MRTASRLLTFALALTAIFAIGFGIGRAAGPEPGPQPRPSEQHTMEVTR